MLLAINIENSRISLGVFDGCGNILLNFKVSTDKNKTSDEYCAVFSAIMGQRNFDIEKIDAVIMASVVPQLTTTVYNTARQLTGVEPMVVGPGLKTGFSIKIDSPAELGGDIVANTAAVLQMQKEKGGKLSPTVMVDMNTVTTVSAINSNGEYVGCCICPGIQLSFDSMHGNTAQLPNVCFSAPKKVIGKNSQDSVRSGVVFGNAIMLDGFVYRFAKEMKCRIEDMDLIITGEYAEFVIGVCNHSFVYNRYLTLNGLYVIYRNNIR